MTNHQKQLHPLPKSYESRKWERNKRKVWDCWRRDDRFSCNYINRRLLCKCLSLTYALVKACSVISICTIHRRCLCWQGLSVVLWKRVSYPAVTVWLVLFSASDYVCLCDNGVMTTEGMAWNTMAASVWNIRLWTGERSGCRGAYYPRGNILENNLLNGNVLSSWEILSLKYYIEMQTSGVCALLFFKRISYTYCSKSVLSVP